MFAHRQETQLPTSPVPEIVGTNAAATESQEIVIREAIENARSDQVRLDEDLERTKARFDQLLRERQGLSHFIETHQGFISPVRRIPSEVISEIFIHCLPLTSSFYRPEDAPLVLGRVCRAWRSIAFSTPKLW
jgi:hypothetical protein